MNIITLTAEHAEAYRELRLEALLDNPDAFITTYEQEKQQPNPINSTAENLDSKDTSTVGLFNKERLVGVATLTQEKHPKFAHKGSILALYVTSSFRNQGVAELLIQKVIEGAKDLEIEVLHIAVVTNNTPAIQLYEKIGFQVYGTEHRAIKLKDRYLDEYWMELFI
ncbi:GNAT family N-acetyltransferase [Halobacillus seohaensis]|uniref:GNAT family N-acetyltransferase n=1 Tax=Halobacillus seohaensis TaxID=447421 RepID=A0ABW2EK32_9BACI